MSHVLCVIEAAIANRPYRIEYGAEQCDDLCYLGDSANAFITALDSKVQAGKFRAYNISAGELISLREMIGILKALYPSWNAEAGPGLDYDDTDAGITSEWQPGRPRMSLALDRASTSGVR